MNGGRGDSSHCTVGWSVGKSLQSCLTLCDTIDGSPPGSPIPGILQARTLEWVAISFSSAWKWKVKVKSLSHVRPSATPWTYNVPNTLLSLLLLPFPLSSAQPSNPPHPSQQIGKNKNKKQKVGVENRERVQNAFQHFACCRQSHGLPYPYPSTHQWLPAPYLCLESSEKEEAFRKLEHDTRPAGMSRGEEKQGFLSLIHFQHGRSNSHTALRFPPVALPLGKKLQAIDGFVCSVI